MESSNKISLEKQYCWVIHVANITKNYELSKYYDFLQYF